MNGLDLMKIEKELFETEKGFENLKQSQQALFLKFLKKTYKMKTVLSKRGYDILSDKFFVETYALERNDKGKLLPVMHREMFATFKAYFGYLSGDVYTNSCYFGYEFSEKEIKEFNLQTERLNFESFIDFDVDGTKKELINERKKNEKGNPSFSIVKKFYSNEHFYASVEMTYGKTTTRKDYTFDYVCDFIHFLKKDLSNADLYDCNNISRLSKITGLNVERTKMKFDGIEAFNLQKEEGLILSSLPCVSFEPTKGNELKTLDQYGLVSTNQNEYTFPVSYMSDVHLTHKLLVNSCKTIYDEEEVINKLSYAFFNETQTKISLFAGDLTDKFDLYEKFLKRPSLFRHRNKFFFTLGNHELWAFPHQSLEETITKYRCLLEDEDVNLVQNDVYYFPRGDAFFLRDPVRISEQELYALSSDDLHKKLRDASLIIFGGIGFAGANPLFNAKNGIYQNILSREEEIEETKKFCSYYKKIIDAAKGMNLIVLTHMPLKDWLGEEKYEPGVLYVSGHTHNNYRCDDGIRRIYSDNQSGYMSKTISWKETSIDFGFDWFKDHKDGIYPITIADYRLYYRGINEGMNLKKEPGQLYLLKRDGFYMFLCKDEKLYFMQGGKKLKLESQDVHYYYEKMRFYAHSIKQTLSTYDSAQNHIASEIKKIGGSGLIHGCIIDIDYFNHIYLNPFDGKITPYYASFMTTKTAYQNIASLLSDKCPTLYSKYQALIDGKKGNSLTTLGDNNISKKTDFVTDTKIYRISRLIKQLQFIGKYGLIRQWNDEVPNKEAGSLILRDMLIGEEQ